MPYDEKKDQVLRKWDIGEELRVSVYQYDGGKPKLQIGPRVKVKDGETHYNKVGRLTMEEVQRLTELAPEIISAMRCATVTNGKSTP